MRRVSLLRSTPLRLAATFGSLFVLAFLSTGFIAYQILKADLATGLDNTARETWSVVAATYGQGDLEDLVSVVETYARLTKTQDRIFLLLDRSGNTLAGNFNSASIPAGIATLRAGDLSLPGNLSYRLVSGAIGDNRLAVGVSLAETDRLETIALSSFVWALGLVIAIAFAGGTLLASRVQRRLDRIADTMIAVSNGRLDARIPLLGSGDDIDVVSSQINAALERLAALVEGMKQVSTDIAHDLKTPLNRLKLTIDSAVNSVETGVRVADQLSEARAEVERINETFDALLRIAQIEAGSRKARFAPVNLDEVVASIVEIYADVAEDDDKTLTVAGEYQPANPISGDRELLVQMFSNLVENAIRHCGPGTRIEIKFESWGDKLVTVVSDNGPGIPAAERDRVFQRLYRIEKSRTTFGSGLGLSLVRAIAELHSADLLLDDNQPGVRVRIAFPAR